MTGRLADKVAVITGGGSGLGRASALRFAAEGAAVAIADLSPAAAEETVALVEKEGGQALGVAMDVADAASVDSAFDVIATRLGRVDVLLNSAGIASRGSVANAEEADWDRCFAVNVKGTFLAARAALRHMEPAEGQSGSIINIASVAGLVSVENAAAYCASKGAVISLTRSMANDLAPRRVRVNCICPGTVFTPLMEPLIMARGGGDYHKGMAMTLEKYPIGRLGNPDDIANLALFLASEEAAWMTGSIIADDGGMTSR
jgi:NAD(P)-dependent dehydrogenase (short-subunit alcohol dehydrogenase family)